MAYAMAYPKENQFPVAGNLGKNRVQESASRFAVGTGVSDEPDGGRAGARAERDSGNAGHDSSTGMLGVVGSVGQSSHRHGAGRDKLLSLESNGSSSVRRPQSNPYCSKDLLLSGAPWATARR